MLQEGWEQPVGEMTRFGLRLGRRGDAVPELCENRSYKGSMHEAADRPQRANVFLLYDARTSSFPMSRQAGPAGPQHRGRAEGEDHVLRRGPRAPFRFNEAGVSRSPR